MRQPSLTASPISVRDDALGRLIEDASSLVLELDKSNRRPGRADNRQVQAEGGVAELRDISLSIGRHRDHAWTQARYAAVELYYRLKSLQSDFDPSSKVVRVSTTPTLSSPFSTADGRGLKALQARAEKLPEDVQVRAKAAFRQFMDDPRHPSLHFEKLSGSADRTVPVDRGGYRIILRGEKSRFELVDIGTHDFVDKRYG